MAWRILQRLTLTLLLSALSVLGGGVAFAYWGNTGTGTATSTTGTNTPVTLTPGVAPTGLYPGAQANVALSISNPNPNTAFIGSLTLDTSQGASGYAIDAGHSGCSTTALSYTTATNGGAGWTVPAKAGAINGSLPVTVTNPLSMNANAANACQGASITIYLAAGP